MVTLPGATPVTSPVAETVASELSELDHVTRRDNAFPLPSLVTAVNCSVEPTVTCVDGPLTVTEATGTLLTVTVIWPLCPSLVAVMMAVPTPTAVTNPVDETVATPVFELDQVIVRPVSTLPFASLVTATYCEVLPTVSPVAGALMVTVATGACRTV